MNHIRLYDLFRKELHLTDDKAADAVFAVQEFAESAVASKEDMMVTKEDIYSIKSEMNAKINTEINSVRKDIQDAKDNIYRAIYLSGILQFIAMTGSFLAIIKLMK
jgi:cobalamin biosynthesis protein CobD/CbiB